MTVILGSLLVQDGQMDWWWIAGGMREPEIMEVDSPKAGIQK